MFVRGMPKKNIINGFNFGNSESEIKIYNHMLYGVSLDRFEFDLFG